MAHKARKRFGQNFLVDQQVINQIVSTIAPKRMDSIIEIGPGKGALTFPLIDHLDHIHVIEIDRDLISLLQKKSNKKITIHESDALVFNFDQFTKNIRIVGNLPYNISSPLLFHLLNYRDSIIDMTFMLQKEVVDRIVAAPGSKVYGRTSVIMQAFFDTELMFVVPKESFDPQPKIESAILYLKTKSEPLVQNLRPLEEIVKIAFSQRRKTLKNCLKSVLNQSQTDIDLSQRAEMLSVENFVTLMNDYEKQN
ncbi:MAG: 16S rRNA (adenine(1518)-N(6)/adenine(1519)-N(6))-dimethyltransferase RsmA [Thiotrichales bacterium]|jgi:16S rRNA (adenine1518-N6/adenine1519-N6)-dimethyltransferase|nr:16S rRNA (adenine(1518)-N(6)/adenine(1519)-N(6))-dimethyltransferase RsmA [Thiotrichales bacterium]MBT3854777.1 16S rRNA (adenine(1518)-N(6)/adenine(1519)-N(6))-dimethyltransferase RsmA [Thiotrichales bacterium]MBT4653960.1 16S rRNA (adenine(1518)-N(6)/adenine(1519)-N(6))-dimethyltransferase RsmA [Thiotrichales bacterium]MBT5984032.1 16S rRNA (adenine(1518)-N(6)/adenine(1519)-N(6))-dimethyltransferase RsmA [Thiotrichales bacterium]MBT6771515.1 16S rRNA (adenine(1518)-N(6)/adenine(1519)-N(6))